MFFIVIVHRFYAIKYDSLLQFQQGSNPQGTEVNEVVSKRKMRAEEYVRVGMEHVEVSMRDNFEFLLELRYKLEKR